MEVVANGDNAQVEISYAKGGDKLFIGAVADLCTGNIRQHLIDTVLIFVDRQHLVPEFVKLQRNMLTKASQANE